MIRFLVLAAALLGVAGVPSHLHAQATSAQPTARALNLLHPGDAIKVRIWREPDLSGEYNVDEAGYATFPKIGRYLVTDESPETLKEKLVASYAQYLRNPSIEVVLLRRINVLGAVKAPGLYPVDATMTIADALALAGGATSVGDFDRIELLRGGKRVMARLSQAQTIATLDIRSGDQLFVPERSWITRNAGIFASMITASASLLVAFIINRSNSGK